MPHSKRWISSESVLLGELLIGAMLLGSAAPARADDDERPGRRAISAGEVTQGSQEEAWERYKFFFGDEDAPDPVLLRGSWFGERSNRFDDPERTRQLEELLDGIEKRLNKGFNEGRWIPLWRHEEGERERGRPHVLFGLDAPEPAAPVVTDSWRSRFRLRLASGLEYRQEFGELDRKLEMRVFGPVVQGHPGLGFRLQGRVLELPFQLEAYGVAKEAGIRFDLLF